MIPEPRRILLLSLSGIGDSLLFSPALGLLGKQFPKTEIHVLVMFKSVANYFSRFKEITQTHYWDFVNEPTLASLWHVWKLRRIGFDLVINAYPSNRAGYNIVARMLGRRQIGHKYLHYNHANLYFLNRPFVVEELNRHPVFENLELVQAIGTSGELEKRLQFPLLEKEHQASAAWLESSALTGKALVGMHAGSSVLKNHTNKRWPWKRFAELGKRLRDEKGLSVLLFGGPEENELMETICGEIGEGATPVKNLALGESAALVDRCGLFVGNDAALMHIAAALQTPVVGIFGPTDVRKGRPFNSPHEIASRCLSCSPCFYYSPRPLHCKFGTFECLRDLTVDEVFGCCERLLDRA